MSSNSSSKKDILVVGATGATGKHVVQMLLDQGRTVRVLVRSKEKMVSLIRSGEKYEASGQLIVKEAALMELTDEELKELTQNCDAIVSCLGHNMTFRGMFREGHFVSDSVQRLTTAMPGDCRFILMGSDGVSHPDGTTDPVRPLSERCVLSLLRWLVPPHVDNEKAALYLHQNRETIDWCVVRPTNLIDGDATGEYDIFDCQHGALFGDSIVIRADAAHFITRLVTEKDTTYAKYQHQMPIIYGTEAEAKKRKAMK